ncbi:TRI39 ligase, partial [Atractosteus spatula]|nr:TRI39 ligase [Atractosteus spatula]
MAEGSISVSQDQFSCSVCLDLLKDPVTLLCGHSYCMGCIKNHWDQEDQTGIYSCPQCRQTFTPRPDLHRNTILAEVVEKLKETGCSRPPPAHSPAGPGDVLCDVCTGRKKGAVKSCLVCLASYCQTHLQPHYEAVPLKRHKLTDATGQLQEKICSTHHKLCEVYCRTDEKCVCYLCAMDEHRGHDTVSAAAGRTEKQNMFLGSRQDVRCGRTHGLPGPELKPVVKHVSHKLVATGLISTAEVLCFVVQREVQTLYLDVRMKTEVSRLCFRYNFCVFRFHFTYRCADPGGSQDFRASMLSQGRMKDPEIYSPRERETPEGQQRTKMRDRTEKERPLAAEGVATKKNSRTTHNPLYSLSIGGLLFTGTNSNSDRKTIGAAVTLDPDTAHCELSLSEDKKRVRRGQRKSLSHNPHRFDYWRCVMSREAFTSGRHYWEVEVNRYWIIGVTRESVQSKGDFRFSPEKGYWMLRYWSLHSKPFDLSALTDPRTHLPLSLRPRKLGVCVDFEERKVSFYTVESRAHLYTFTDMVFTQGEKIYPVFCTWDSDKDLELLPAVSGD